MYARLMVIGVCAVASKLIAENSIVVRAAIDMGTSGPKLQVARVNLETSKIDRILHTERFFVNFHGSLAKSSILSEEIKSEGRQAFQKAVEKAKTFNPTGIVAVATAAFRHAVNGLQFAQEIEEKNGIKVHVIDQKLEGELSFRAVLAKTRALADNLLVWDIGGGSTQFIGEVDGECHVDGSKEGSGPFRDYIIEKIQGRSIHAYKTPNPISEEDLQRALVHARSLSQKVNEAFNARTRTVVGVGTVFGVGISNRMGKTSFTREELKAVVQQMVGKSDEELGGGDFACVEASNAILALGFMGGVQIEKMEIIHVNNADGALIYHPFW